MFAIEKGIPAPKMYGAPIKYPFDSMDIGDSFFVPTNNVAITTANFTKGRYRDPNKKFSVRKAEGGLRVWRIL